ncbi:hypothetical protein LXA43DRAFT_190515 [Ganoderma leucocontextum]|nr:hypothetical protein LXA43DRAFT_190515 [Ganoderma leucocontextum]
MKSMPWAHTEGTLCCVLWVPVTVIVRRSGHLPGGVINLLITSSRSATENSPKHGAGPPAIIVIVKTVARTHSDVEQEWPRFQSSLTCRYSADREKTSANYSSDHPGLTTTSQKLHVLRPPPSLLSFLFAGTAGLWKRHVFCHVSSRVTVRSPTASSESGEYDDDRNQYSSPTDASFLRRLSTIIETTLLLSLNGCLKTSPFIRAPCAA